MPETNALGVCSFECGIRGATCARQGHARSFGRNCRAERSGSRRRLKGADDGDCQMVLILTTVLSDGIEAVEGACQQALAENLHLEPVIEAPNCGDFSAYDRPLPMRRGLYQEQPPPLRRCSQGPLNS